MQLSFVHNDSIRDLLGFRPNVIYEEYNLSDNPVNTLSIAGKYLETDIAQSPVFKKERTGLIHKFTKNVYLGSKQLKTSLRWY